MSDREPHRSVTRRLAGRDRVCAATDGYRARHAQISTVHSVVSRLWLAEDVYVCPGLRHQFAREARTMREAAAGGRWEAITTQPSKLPPPALHDRQRLSLPAVPLQNKRSAPSALLRAGHPPV